MLKVTMFPCEADLQLYTTKRLPQWAQAMREAREKKTPKSWSRTELIDTVVNAHAHVRPTSGEVAAQNLMFLVSICMRRTPEALEDYLYSISTNPQCAISPKRRAGFARKWARKLSERKA